MSPFWRGLSSRKCLCVTQAFFLFPACLISLSTLFLYLCSLKKKLTKTAIAYSLACWLACRRVRCCRSRVCHSLICVALCRVVVFWGREERAGRVVWSLICFGFAGGLLVLRRFRLFRFARPCRLSRSLFPAFF